MSLFRSRPICVTCNRHLPGAATRCPWCKTPILAISARRASATVHGRGAHRPLSSRFGGGDGQ
jgi:predicted amidophosphoribosyltransferase